MALGDLLAQMQFNIQRYDSVRLVTGPGCAPPLIQWQLGRVPRLCDPEFNEAGVENGWRDDSISADYLENSICCFSSHLKGPFIAIAREAHSLCLTWCFYGNPKRINQRVVLEKQLNLRCDADVED